jgi:hypothetical protein
MRPRYPLEWTRQQPRGAQLGLVDEVLTILARSFRGATAYPRGWGAWRDDERGGTLFKEEPVIVFSYVAEADLTSTPYRNCIARSAG